MSSEKTTPHSRFYWSNMTACLCKLEAQRLFVGSSQGGLVPLCNRNALGSVFDLQIENMPNCKAPLY